MAAHPIPADQVWWEASSALQDRNEALLRDIAEKSMPADPKRDSIHQKLGDYYAACVDETSADAAGIKPIEAELQRISAIDSQGDLAEESGRLHRMLYLLVQGSIFPSVADPGSRELLFGFSSYQDFQDASSKVVAFVDQGGLGLPDRDSYLHNDADSVELRHQYVAHIRNMLALLKSESDGGKAANRILDIETALARSWMDVVARRDRENLNHPYSLDALQRLMPNFDWGRFLAAIGAPQSEHYLVANPEFLKTMNSLLGSISLDDWKTYLRWNLLRASAGLLSQSFVNGNFAFYGKVLTGAKENAPRWKRCVWAADRDLQDAVGQAFVKESFHEDDKQHVLQIVKEVEAAFDGVIRDTDWLSPDTRALALAKLHAITNRVGYPERWRDYSSLPITRDNWAVNAFHSSEYELARQLDHIGKPPDRNEWGITVTTLDAYNNPRQNSVTFPAGWLAAPIFDRLADDPINFGDLGALAGHEVTHGFDSMGRKYDASGNLREWWTAEDTQRFAERSKCLVDQYSSYVAVDNVKLNGELTLAENIADGAGARLAYLAFRNRAKSSLPVGKLTDGFTPEQRFFLSFALHYCGNITPEMLKLIASGDAHSTLKQRVNGVVSNMPEFKQAFRCKAGQPMVRANACQIW
jgi:endothelin-converting enzyme/putative endopeptidase